MAADASVPIAVVIADTDRVAAAQIINGGTQTIADAGHLAVADEVVHLVEVERDVVRVVTSTVDGLVDVRRHQIDDALVVRHFDRQVAHIDRRWLRTQRRLVGNAHVDSNVRVAGVVVRVDIVVRIVVRVAVAGCR